ncbi:MAG: VOC family protein [Gemmatimonadota bacterium]|nr:VOC family protein [Gemmatimonadota bacterium]
MTPASITKRPIDHIAIAVHSIDESRGLYELLSGQHCSNPELLEAHGVRVAFVGSIELLEPLGPETSVGRFLDRRGPSLHHIAYASEDLEGDLTRLDAEGVALIDRVPRVGAGGHRVAFLHPSASGGILIELVERTSAPP